MLLQKIRMDLAEEIADIHYAFLCGRQQLSSPPEFSRWPRGNSEQPQLNVSSETRGRDSGSNSQQPQAGAPLALVWPKRGSSFHELWQQFGRLRAVSRGWKAGAECCVEKVRSACLRDFLEPRGEEILHELIYVAGSHKQQLAHLLPQVGSPASPSGEYILNGAPVVMGPEGLLARRTSCRGDMAMAIAFSHNPYCETRWTRWSFCIPPSNFLAGGLRVVAVENEIRLEEPKQVRVRRQDPSQLSPEERQQLPPDDEPPTRIGPHGYEFPSQRQSITFWELDNARNEWRGLGRAACRPGLPVDQVPAGSFDGEWDYPRQVRFARVPEPGEDVCRRFLAQNLGVRWPPESSSK